MNEESYTIHGSLPCFIEVKEYFGTCQYINVENIISFKKRIADKPDGTESTVLRLTPKGENSSRFTDKCEMLRIEEGTESFKARLVQEGAWIIPLEANK